MALQSPTYKNLPNTPNSCNNTRLSESSDVDLDTNIGSTDSPMEFKLAPTPAQLGKAPLQRRSKCPAFSRSYSFYKRIYSSGSK